MLSVKINLKNGKIMDCLGNNVESIKKKMDSDVRDILQKSGFEVSDKGYVHPVDSANKKLEEDRNNELLRNNMGNDNTKELDFQNNRTNAEFNKRTGLDKVVEKIRQYVISVMGDAFVEQATFLRQNSTTGEIICKFPQSLEAFLIEKEKFNKQAEELDKQAAIEMNANEELFAYQAQELDNNYVFDDSFQDPLQFNPDIVGDISYEEMRRPELDVIPVDFDARLNTADVNSGNASQSQWIKYRKDLKRRLIKSLGNFRNTNRFNQKSDYYKNTIKSFNHTINKLDAEIEQLDKHDNDLSFIYSDVLVEVEELNKLLDNISIESFDTTEILDRLGRISEYFLNKKLDGSYVTEEFKKSNMFLVGGKNPDFEKVRNRVTDLVEKWHNKQVVLIGSIMESNSVVRQHILDGKLKYITKEGKELSGKQTIELIKEKLQNPTDVSWLESRLYGAGKGGGLFGQILRLEMETSLANRQGQTGNILKRIDEVIRNLKETASDKTINILKKFAQKDSLGVSTNILIHKFSNNWFGYQRQANTLINAFRYGSQTDTAKADSYKRAMGKKKSNEDILDPSKIKRFKDNNKINILFTREYFTYSDAEMEYYERELKDRLGEYFVEAMIEEQRLKIEEFIETIVGDSVLSDNKILEQNPFEFVKHFYSEEYHNSVKGKNNADVFLDSRFIISFPLEKTRDGKRNFEYFNKDFAEIEKNKDEFELWNLLNTLITEYINPVLKANGENVMKAELPAVADYLSNEILKNAEFGERGIMWSQNLLNSWGRMFASSEHADLHKDRPSKIRSGYTNSIMKRAKDMTKLLSSRKIEDLVEIAKEEGINYDINSLYYQKLEGIDRLDRTFDEKRSMKDNVNRTERERLAKSIANKKTFSMTDENFTTTIRALTGITDNLAARTTANNIANLMIDYVSSKKTDKTTDKNFGLKNTLKFLEDWQKRNIEFDTVHGDRKKNAEGELKGISKLLNKKIGGKWLSMEDKKFREFLQNEVKNIDKMEDFDFKLGETVYSTKKGRYLEKKGEAEDHYITREEIESKYAEYLGEKMAALGIDRTIGSLFSGLMSTVVQKALALNPKAGFRNLWEGGTKNMMIAASGRYDFGLPELQNAKDFLWGINTDRYLEFFGTQKILTVNKFGTEHALNMRTYKMLIQQFGEIQDKKNQFARAEDYEVKKWKFKFGLMDFAVENPEAHNQGELILCKLQSTYIKYIDENGEQKERAIFDGEKKDFIWLPGTMKLRPEYRTEENIRMWENFSESKGENNQHLSTIFGIQVLIEETQGNYSDRDIVSMQGSTLGRAVMTFKRFYPEHFWQMWGKQDFDLFKGETNFKARKAVMLEHAPVTAAYLLATGALAASGGFVGMVIGGGALLGFVTNYLINRFINQQKTQIKFDINSLKLAASWTAETISLTLERPLSMITRGRTPLGKFYLTNTILGKTQNWKPPTMTSKERAVLSENAMEVAQRTNLILCSLAIITGLKALAALLAGGDDDDEYKESLKRLEGTMNLVLNTNNTLQSQFDEFNNPITLLKNIGSISILSTLDNANKVWSQVGKVISEDAPPVGIVSPLSKSFFFPVPIPNSVVDYFTKDNVSFLSDQSVYDNVWYNGMKDSASKAEGKRLINQRAKTRDVIEDFYFDKVFSKENFPNESWAKRKAMSKKAAKKEMGIRYRRMKGESEGNALNRIDFSKERKAWKNNEVTPDFSWYDLLKQEE